MTGTVSVVDLVPVLIPVADGSWLAHAPESAPFRVGAMGATEDAARLAFVEALQRLASALDRNPEERIRPVRRPPALDDYPGMWVAVLDGDVIAAAPTSHELAVRLHEMDHRRRHPAVVEYVRPMGDAYIVGAG